MEQFFLWTGILTFAAGGGAILAALLLLALQLWAEFLRGLHRQARNTYYWRVFVRFHRIARSRKERRA